MKTIIETNPKFRFRLEDYVYSSLVIVGFLISMFVYFILSKVSIEFGNKLLFMIIFNLFCIVLVVLLIHSSFKNRLRAHCYIEDECLIKYFDDKLVFKIPLNEIVSIRINDRRVNEGSIIFFTSERSKEFTFAYIPLFIPVPAALYGMTKFKINLVKDRKWLVTKLVQANPKLNFIENR